MKTKALALCAVLVALALGLSYLERFLPLQMAVPLPGVKLGLANIVTLMALYFLGTRPAVTILGLRCVLGSLFGGGLSALAFSLTGGLLALGTMTLARRIPALSVYGVSVLGAAAHNLGQICAAMVLLGSVYVISYLPFPAGGVGPHRPGHRSGLLRLLPRSAGRRTAAHPHPGGVLCWKPSLRPPCPSSSRCVR